MNTYYKKTNTTMNKIVKNLSTLALAFFATLSVNAQNESSLLWEIKGNGLENSSYVFGTIHMICEEDYIMTAVIENTLKNVDAYYAELDFSNMENMVEMQKALQANEPLSKRLSTEEYATLKKLLNETFGMDILHFENLSDAAIASTLTFKSFPCDSHKMYEMELLQMALSSKKEMGGLETVQSQLEVMSNSFNPKAIIKLLEDFQQLKYESTNKMVELYKSQDIEGLLNFMNEASYMDEKTADMMLHSRNHNWIEIMPDIMKNKSTFFAVGAAHLGGETGVIALLKQKGYTVTPVKI